MTDGIILGIIQGITEWLPISSEGALVLVQIFFFGQTKGATEMIQLALFLHLGTFLAALLYFRKDVLKLIKTLFYYKKADEETKKIFKFLFWASVVSALFGWLVFRLFIFSESKTLFTTRVISWVIGILLIITALFYFQAKKGGEKTAKELKKRDSFVLGLLQGLTILPGFSRSGLTTAGLLLRKFKQDFSLKLSFLMSLPAVLGANIILNFNNFLVDKSSLIGLFFAFVFGLLTIHILLKLAEKINWFWFVLIFGILTILSSLF